MAEKPPELDEVFLVQWLEWGFGDLARYLASWAEFDRLYPEEGLNESVGGAETA